jgi:putative membrane protein
MMIRLLAPLVLLLAPSVASAHLGGSDPQDAGWSADLLVLIPLTLAAGLYGLGLVRLWRRAGIGRGVPIWRALMFGLGLAILALALLSPLDSAGEASFAMHMAQHMLLIVVAAPLLALAQSGPVLLMALPAGMRRPIASARHLRRIFATVPAATLLHGVTIWLWHVPGPYEAALADDLVHYLEHLSMLATAVLFWWAACAGRSRPPLGHGAGVAAMFVTMVHTGLLGILITLAPAPLYATYAAAEPFLGLSALEDQQVAGMIMLLPGGIAYVTGGLALLAAWLGAISHRQASRARLHS